MTGTESPPRLLRLTPSDDVAVAIDALKPGAAGLGVAARAAIPRGHKMALVAVPRGAPVHKFGQVIGVATADIAPGDWVHGHNLGMPGASAGSPMQGAAAAQPAAVPATFQGFRRASGRTGTRNYLGVVTTVNCAATVARHAAEAARQAGLLDAWPQIDGVVPIVHGTGCGMAARGEGFDLLRRTLWGYAAHPNFAAVLLVGLGCEVMQIDRLREERSFPDDGSFRSLTIQESGGTRRCIDAILGALREMLPQAAAAQRQTRPASELVLGLQCGGSDAFSALTANPALGCAADRLVAAGGTPILSETPEIYGAEHLLLARAARPDIADALRARLGWWQDYTSRHGAALDNNPSPGNKAGGLTTILEKSLGAVAKSGHTPLRAVLGYAEPVITPGLVFMDTPGYDPVSATGQVAGGANLLAFTTGRGSVFGAKPTPCLKLATTSQLYAAMQEDMDIDCGDVLEGVSLEQKGAEIFAALLATASGQRTKSELAGYGDSEFVPWQLGAVV